MTQKAATFFDDIIKSLVVRGETAKFANISPETAREFFSDNLKPLSVQQMPASSPVEASVQTQINPEMTFPASPPVIPVPQTSAAYVQSNANSSTQDVASPAVSPVVPQTSTDTVDITQMDMETLQRVALQCTQCDLHKGRKNVVFGAGNTQADLMFIGEGPGRDEDIQGIPFVGEAGQLLTKMVNAMQFQRSDIYIANIVKCRPPNNRNPEDNEAAACMPYLKRQIQLINPKVIVVLGAVPLKYLLGKTGITKRRGVWDSFEGIQVMPTFHPAYLLRNASAKKQVWEDLQKVMQVFGRTYSPVQKR